MQSNETPFAEVREALATALYAASAQEGGNTDHDLSEAEAGYYADVALGYVGEKMAEAQRVADVRLKRITQLLNEQTLTPDERDWLIMIARMVRHETEHPTAVETLSGLRVSIRRSDAQPNQVISRDTRKYV
ncbi:hypothetical protein [Microbacterium enclense]|uniref:hypothetical protein n=1 Tax=Microbacterium enclense TaxID=993073 RepID=UPI003432A934